MANPIPAAPIASSASPALPGPVAEAGHGGSWPMALWRRSASSPGDGLAGPASRLGFVLELIRTTLQISGGR